MTNMPWYVLSDFGESSTQNSNHLRGGGSAGASSSVIVKNYSANMLGIQCPSALAAPVPVASSEFDFATQGAWQLYERQPDGNGGYTPAAPALGAVTVHSAVLAPNTSMSVTGSAYADVMEGGSLVDTVYGVNNAPRSKVLHGLNGDDRLYAVTGQSVQDAVNTSLSYTNIPTQAYLQSIGAPTNVYAQAAALDGDYWISTIAMQFIAIGAHPVSARDRFDAQTRAMNDTNWRVAA